MSDGANQQQQDGGGAHTPPHDDDSSDDGLWNEFENCATSVTHLYRNSNWRTLQSAAASTTQLYKHGLETKKRSFDRGFTKGRRLLARELSSMCHYKNKIDVGDIVALLSKYDLLASADVHHHHHHHAIHRHHHNHHAGGQSPRQQQQQRNTTGGGGEISIVGPGLGHQMETGGGGGGMGLGAGNPNAVFVFQEALAPVSNPSTSPHRTGLDSFLQNQVCRHRKRSHSPGSGGLGVGGGGGCGTPSAFDFVSKRFKRL